MAWNPLKGLGVLRVLSGSTETYTLNQAVPVTSLNTSLAFSVTSQLADIELKIPPNTDDQVPNTRANESYFECDLRYLSHDTIDLSRLDLNNDVGT